MSKISVIIASMKQAKDIKNKVDAYLIPLKELSINYPNTFRVEEIKELIK